MVLSLSRLAVESRKAKPSAFGAMAFATARLPRLLALAVFEFIALALFCLALFFSVLLLAWIDWLGIVAAFFFGIIGFFAWLVFSFALPAMAAADASLKDSLKASWAFVSKHVISAVALMLLLGFLSAVVNEIGGLLSNVFAGIEALSIAIVFVFLAFALAFSNLSVAFFFLGKEAAGPEAFASKRDRRRHERRFGR